MKTPLIVSIIAVCGMAAHAFATTVLVIDPALTSGTDAITSNTVATGSATPESWLEELTGFAAIHDFAFAGNQTTTKDFVFSFTSARLPDFKLNYTGTVQTSSNPTVNYTGNGNYYSSASSCMRLASAANTNTSGLNIQLGSYDAVNDVFTNFASGQGVMALGFTINGSRFSSLDANGLTVTYKDALGNTLSTQYFAPVSGVVHGYTGYESTEAPIASVSFGFTGAGGSVPAPMIGLDDLGATLVTSVPLDTATNVLVTDPVRTSGASAITSNAVATGGATPETTLEGLTGFAAIHDFTFAGYQSTTKNFVFNFTDSALPDFRLFYSGDVKISGGPLVNYTSNGNYWSSGSSTLRLESLASTSHMDFTIQLGSYDAANDVFTKYPAGQGVIALGFTINGSRFASLDADGLTVTYKDALGNVLSTQNFAATSGTIHGYTGYQSTGTPIASVSLSFTGAGGSVPAPMFGLDDLGTTLATYVTPVTNSLASRANDGFLDYSVDGNGNRLPDFSYAGYKLSAVPIPSEIPVMATVSPVTGDNTANIQSAINAVSAMPLDAQGFRGVVQLNPGTYELSSTLAISQSGVVLRGAGAGIDGSIIYHTGTAQKSTITIGKSGLGLTYKADITDNYVPVGNRFITVSNAAGLSVGQTIAVTCTPTQAWVDALQMTDYWVPTDFVMQWLRKIVSVNGTMIELDAPLTSIVDNGGGFGLGKVYTINDTRLNNVGVEDIMFVSYYDRTKQQADGYYNDDTHAVKAIYFTQAVDCWVQRCTGYFYQFAFVQTWSLASRITVQDCAMIDGVAIDTPTYNVGTRKYYYSMDGSNLLVQRCYARGGRHSFVANTVKSNNNVFLNCYSVEGHQASEPHQRWSTAILYDNVYSDSSFRLAGDTSDHGQYEANSALWNCHSHWGIALNSPAQNLGTNWVVGTILDGTSVVSNQSGYGAEGVTESIGSPVYPRSLFMAQARDRVGEKALYSIVTNDQYLASEAVYQKLQNTYSAIPEFGDPANISSWAPNTPNYTPTIAVQGSISLLDDGVSIAEWSHSSSVTSPVQTGSAAARWMEANLNAYRPFAMSEPASDWSDYQTLDFWMYSGVANNARVILTVRSENAATLGDDYYSYPISIDWSGWKHFSIPLTSGFSAVGSPVGWNKIDSVTFANKASGAVVKGDTELYFDDIRVK